MEGDRSWMYGPRYVDRKVNPVFVRGVEEFFNYAFAIPNNIDRQNRIKCPCAKCGCTRWWDRYTIGKHLLKSGFRPYYETWNMHGEHENVRLGEQSQTVVEEVVAESVDVESPNDMIEMVVDAAGPSFNWEQPNPKAQEFYNMMNAADELFTPTHTSKKTGQFISARAKKAQEDYDRDMIAKYGPDRALWPAFDSDVWYANTDNNAHSDNYGLGALGKTRSMYRPGASQTSSSRSQSQTQSYSSAPPPLRQEDINAISSQVLGVLQPQLNVINQFMEEMRRNMGRSSPHQGGSSSHRPDEQDDSGDDLGDD